MKLFSRIFSNSDYITNNQFTSLFKDHLKKYYLDYFDEFFSTIYKKFFKVKFEEIEKNIDNLKSSNEMLHIEIEKLKNLHSVVIVPPTPTGYVYPLSEEINSITWVWNEPSGEPEDYLIPFMDDLSGSTVIRVGDETAFGITGQQVGMSYAKRQPWNSNETLIMLTDGPGGARILNADDYTVDKIVDLPPNPAWSNLDPNILYGDSGNSFVKHTVDTNTRSTVRTFSDYTDISFGYAEGNQDKYDKYVCLIGEKAGGTRHLIVYDIQLDSIYAELEISNSASLDWASVSIEGNYVVLNFENHGTGANLGIWCYDIDLTNGRQISTTSEHGDCCIDQNGDEVYVQFRSTDEGGYFMEMCRLSDGEKELLFYDTGSPKGIYGGHISGRNFDRTGWAYVSETCCANTAGVPNENFAIKLDWDGDNIIQRFGFNYGSRVGTSQDDEVKMCPNRSGTKLLFNSYYYDSTLETWSYPPAWVMEYPQN